MTDTSEMFNPATFDNCIAKSAACAAAHKETVKHTEIVQRQKHEVDKLSRRHSGSDIIIGCQHQKNSVIVALRAARSELSYATGFEHETIRNTHDDNSQQFLVAALEALGLSGHPKGEELYNLAWSKTDNDMLPSNKSFHQKVFENMGEMSRLLI